MRDLSGSTELYFHGRYSGIVEEAGRGKIVIANERGVVRMVADHETVGEARAKVVRRL